MGYIKIVILLLLGPVIGMAQTHTAAGEQQLQNAYHKVYPACVRAYGIDSVTRAQNGSPFSAVVVSADGILLTVAHATSPGKLYRISFPDGKTTVARALGRIATDRQSLLPDVAMMKITEAGSWPFAELGSSASLQVGASCFGISYPESQNLTVPMLRWGSILNVLDEWGLMESSCIMEVGDSGGPLFDEQGKLIGLHSRISRPEGANYEVPVDIYRKYFTALQVVKNYEHLPDSADERSVADSRYEPGAQQLHTTIAAQQQNVALSAIVKIYSNRDTVLGTLFQLKNGRQIIVSKSSMVGDLAFINIRGQSISLKVIQRDKGRDLVALHSFKPLPQSLLVSKIKAAPATDSMRIGEFLYTPLLNQPPLTSVTGLLLEDLPKRYSSGGFDAYLQEQNGCPTITKTDSGGVAATAGLRAGDCIFRINNISVNGVKDFNDEMMKYYPGDTVLLNIRRHTDTFATALVLVPRTIREQPHPMNDFAGGKSIRRDGFKHVILHDARLRSYECGTPLYNLKGKLVGFNIARFSHTTTIALAKSELLAFLEKIN